MSGEPTTTDVRGAGLEPHVPRYSDTDPKVGRGFYGAIVALFGVVAPVLGLAFLVTYFAVPRTMGVDILVAKVNLQHLLFGLCLGLALLAIGIGLELWAKQIMTDEESSEERHAVSSSDADRRTFLGELAQGVADSGVSRRRLILSSLLGAVGVGVLPALVTLGDMGPWPGPGTRKATIMKTIWAEGVRLVNDVTYAPLKADELKIGQLVNAEPESIKDLKGAEFQQAKAKAAIIVVRMDPAAIKIPESRKDWQVDGILCYSKICTHVGCPISLWEKLTHHLLCPCHQSTFDLADSGVVIFGPAARSLPQLPITTDKDGYLVARSDFTVPVGPSFFERDSRGDYKEGDR